MWEQPSGNSHLGKASVGTAAPGCPAAKRRIYPVRGGHSCPPRIHSPKNTNAAQASHLSRIAREFLSCPVAARRPLTAGEGPQPDPAPGERNQ